MLKTIIVFNLCSLRLHFQQGNNRNNYVNWKLLMHFYQSGCFLKAHSFNGQLSTVSISTTLVACNFTCERKEPTKFYFHFYKDSKTICDKFLMFRYRELLKLCLQLKFICSSLCYLHCDSLNPPDCKTVF